VCTKLEHADIWSKIRNIVFEWGMMTFTKLRGVNCTSDKCTYKNKLQSSAEYVCVKFLASEVTRFSDIFVLMCGSTFKFMWR
jgi:hypothetical protein